MSQPSPPTSENDVNKNHTSWEDYRRPYVRDLAFALACPDVLTHWIDLVNDDNSPHIAVHSANFWQAQFEAYQERLKELDTTTAYQDLTRYLLSRPSPNRLGFHFEGLLSFWLTDGFALKLHPFEILASNVQLYSGKRTTGELDLILYNHQEQLTEHWELAIKFFMGSAPFAPENWVGINSNDNLQRKMTHMQTKPFTNTTITTEKNPCIHIDRRYAVIKGRFFVPMTTTDFTHPEWLAPHFPLHQWCAQTDHQTLAKIDQSSLRAAHYIEWFTKRDFYDNKFLPLTGWTTSSPQSGLYFDGDQFIVIFPEQENIK